MLVSKAPALSIQSFPARAKQTQNKKYILRKKLHSSAAARSE